MSEHEGWMRLLAGYGETRSPSFPLPAYSEFMPPPRLGRKPYGEPELDLFAQDDPWGWRVSEAEQEWELAPGLEHVAREVVRRGAAQDHPALLSLPESLYLKCLILEVE